MCLVGGGGQLCPALVTAHLTLRPPAPPPHFMLRCREPSGAFPQVLGVPAKLPDLSESGGLKAPTQDYWVFQLSRVPSGLASGMSSYV